MLKKEGYEERLEQLPFIKKLVSANIRPLDDSYHAPPPYVIRELTLRRGSPNRRLKIGILGLTETRPVNISQKTDASFTIDDPFERARQIIPELKSKVDIIVVLAYMSKEDLQRLASENPDIDSVIGARQLSDQSEPLHFNRATITTAYNQTKYLGELRIYAKSDGTIENQLNRYVELDSIIPDDLPAVELVTRAHDEFTNAKNSAAKPTAKPTTILSQPADPPLGGLSK